MRLTKVLEGAAVRYCLNFQDIEILGIADDSRQVKPGFLFLAVKGAAADGHRYIYDAILRGAAALAIEDEAVREEAASWRLPVAVVSNSRNAASRVAANFHGNPARRVRVVGVTGTNGKTTVTHFLRSILRSAGYRAGLLGTINHDLGTRVVKASNTTPGPIELHRNLREMSSAGSAFAVMEVSSHALDQGRTAHVPFAGAVFTNLTSDHLDYHGTRADYLKAKGRLFESLDPNAIAVLNMDDWASAAFAKRCRARLVTYGLGPGADLRYRIFDAGLWGTEIGFSWKGKDLGTVRIAMPGLHNACNAAAAMAFGLASGIGPASSARGLERMPGVPGRLTQVDVPGAFKVFVDYAHTEDALRAVLEGIRGVHDGRILLVFGCGGDRDKTKRPRMGSVAGKLADRSWITSDNPRTECPDAIIRDIEKGMPIRAWYAVEPDREAAIRSAMCAAEAGDAVVIAGKGHEDTQTIGSVIRKFSDLEMVRKLWSEISGETRTLHRLPA